MSAYNNQQPRQLFNSHSGMFYSNAPLSPHNTYPFQPNNIIANRQPTQYSSSEQYNHPPPRNLITQSVIYAPRNEVKPKFGGLSKLQSMARVVSTPQNQDFPSQKRNSCEKAPFSREGFGLKEPSPFASQIVSNSHAFNWYNKQENKSISTQLTQPQARKRRESVDLQTHNRKLGPNDDKFSFLQRGKQLQLIKTHSMVQKYDCESTNSGSGNQLLKPTKNFDFMKKKKEEGDGINGNISANNQCLKPFQPLKKSDMIWPLSISPMEQKSPKIAIQQQVQQSPHANKFQYKAQPLDQNPPVHIQFKKKKVLQGPFTPVTRPELPNRFQTVKATVTEPKPREKQQKQPMLLKNRTMSKYQRQIKIDDFQLVSKLGKGAFGDVYIALEKVLGFMCVIKKMSKKRIKQAKVQQHITREIKLQSYLNHSHITSIYGYFHDQDNLYLVLELLPDGSLQQVKKKKKLPEKQAAEIVRQVAEGLKHMHSEYIIHRDLKPQNLFVNQGYVKIGDLGCSIFHNAAGLRKTIVGCLEYSSPEQLSNQGYTQKIDSWSLGIMTYELLFGKSPFESQIKKMAMAGQNSCELSEVTFPSAPIIREDTKQFILNLLDKDPQKRMDMDEALHHSFLLQEKK